MGEGMIIARLCAMLDEAVSIIRQQAEILAQHGIETNSGALEQKRACLLTEIEKTV